MKKNTKIIISVFVIMIAIITTLIVNKKESVVIENIKLPDPQMQLEVIEDTVYLQNFDSVTFDTITISEEFGEILEANNTTIDPEILNAQKFIINYDINFDGTNDVAVLAGIGYGGVNMFYNFYIVNPETKKFEDYKELPHISNFHFDPVSRKITSTYRSGPEWYADEYTFVNGRYIDTARTLLR